MREETGGEIKSAERRKKELYVEKIIDEECRMIDKEYMCEKGRKK